MIDYNPADWRNLLSCKGSVFPKAMVLALPTALLAAGLHHLFKTNKDLLNLLGLTDAAASVFGGFTFVLGFLVVFRSQQAYGRWWEGGTLLQQLRGEWFNAFSCLVAFSNSAKEKEQDVERFQQQLVRLFSLLYCSALTQVSHMQVNMFELINLDGFDPKSLEFLEDKELCHDKAEVTLQWIQRLIVEAEQKAIIKIAPPILSRVYNELGHGIVNLNNARKIKEFPIPFPLAQIVMVMLFFHALFTPLICAATIKTTGWSAVFAFIVSFCYWSVLFIALELEMPYGDDANDLPLTDMALDMNKSLRSMLCPLASTVPAFTYVSPDSIPNDKQIVDRREGPLYGRDLDVDKDLSKHFRFSERAADGAYSLKIEDASPRKIEDAPKDDKVFVSILPGPNPIPTSNSAPPLASVAVPQPTSTGVGSTARRPPSLEGSQPASPGAQASSSEEPAKKDQPPQLPLPSAGIEAAPLPNAPLSPMSGRPALSPANAEACASQGSPDSPPATKASQPQPSEEELRPNRPNV